MTVRAWFTISGLVVAALFVAVAFRFFAPASEGPPAIIARAGSVRLDGTLTDYCWPQRNGNLRCERNLKAPSQIRAIPDRGRFRVVVAYPVQPVPKSGVIAITYGDGKRALYRKWMENVRYELGLRRYTMTVTAKYPNGVFIRYEFLFRTTRSGS